MRTFRAVPQTPCFRILLIDDNQYGLVIRKALLEQAGYYVVAASTPDSGLAHFQAAEWDVVITDYRMPGMTGAQLIQRMRALRPTTPVILISSVADVLGLDQHNTGADAVIPKTANEVQHMLRAVARLVMPRKPAGRQRSVARGQHNAAAAM